MRSALKTAYGMSAVAALAAAAFAQSPRRADPRDHWAFQPVKRPVVPVVRESGFPIRNPIDAFTAARMRQAGLLASNPAGPETLVRRLYLDLIGLPPTPEERRRFLADSRPDAYERLVDELLARPQYGERWARHWLDVARYAESNGYERDGNKPHAWRYRDYVIDSLNRDKPFDRFLIEQIAGDEMDGANAETHVATTFLRLGTWDDEPADPAIDRFDQLDDVLGVTSSVFLAQTLRCARCHDHKFEPFSQKEYYRALAVFEPLKRPQNDRADLDRFVGTAEELVAYREATRKIELELAPFVARFEPLRQLLRVRAVEAAKADVPKEAADAVRIPPEKRTDAQKEIVSKASEKLDSAAKSVATVAEREVWDAQAAAIAGIEARRPKEPPRAYVWYEDTPETPKTHVLRLGNPEAKGEEVSPGVPAVLCRTGLAGPTPRPKSSGRRLWLAKWIARPENPLTARVIVNRIWQWHFGDGLVASSNDFGLMGQRPKDPALLDWLASEFVRAKWSMKKLHRLIVTSSTYRMSSQSTADALKKDPTNSIPSRWPARRMEAEAYRDSTLSVSGGLNSEMGGPSVYPPLPRAVLEGQSVPGQNWGVSDERQASRRSVYIFVKRSLAVPELEALDSPDTTSSCERRPVSTVAPQALTFLNGEFMRGQAERMAARLTAAAGNEPAKQVRLAYELALSRLPARSEADEALRFLSDQSRRIASTGAEPAQAAKRALASYCLVLLNSSEFAYIR